MNQEKIGKFIAQKRKEKGLKQSDISIKLGVTDKSVSNWERGKNMPDLSLFYPLCKILDVSVNELLSGEEISKKDCDKYEETIINTINYSDKRIKEMSKRLTTGIIVLGIIVTIISLTLFSWHMELGGLYSIIGIILTLTGCVKLTSHFKFINRLIYCFGILVITLIFIFGVDIINIKYNNSKPRFILNIKSDKTRTLYDTPFYDVYSCNNKHNIIKFNSIFAIDNIKEICSE